MDESRTLRDLRAEAQAQVASAADFRARARELLAAARAEPDPEYSAHLEARAAKLQNAANAASAPAIAAGRAILGWEIAHIDPSSVTPVSPAPGLDDYKARLAARKGAAQGGQ